MLYIDVSPHTLTSARVFHNNEICNNERTPVLTPDITQLTALFADSRKRTLTPKITPSISLPLKWYFPFLSPDLVAVFV